MQAEFKNTFGDDFVNNIIKDVTGDESSTGYKRSKATTLSPVTTAPPSDLDGNSDITNKDVVSAEKQKDHAHAELEFNFLALVPADVWEDLLPVPVPKI